MNYEWLHTLEYWHWLVLGIGLLTLEALGTAGFLLGAGIGALLVCCIMLIFDLHWHSQLIIFAISTGIFSFIYWRKFRSFNNYRDDHHNLNNRAAQLIGRKLMLEQPLNGIDDKLQIGDTFWKVQSEESLNVGETIKIIDAKDDMTLILEKAE